MLRDIRDNTPIRRTKRENNYEPKITGLDRVLDKAANVQISRLPSGRYLVHVKGRSEILCDSDAQVAAAVKQLSQPVEAPTKPQRMLVQQSCSPNNPLRRRAIE